MAGGLVLDVVYGQNSTTAYTAGAGQTERWDTNTTNGLGNLRGAGSSESGADTVSMTWTSGPRPGMALLGVSFNPGARAPAAPTTAHGAAGPDPDRRLGRGRERGPDLDRPEQRRRQSADRIRDLARPDQRRRKPC